MVSEKLHGITHSLSDSRIKTLRRFPVSYLHDMYILNYRFGKETLEEP